VLSNAAGGVRRIATSARTKAASAHFGDNAPMPPKDAQPGLRISPFIDRLAHKATMVANAHEGYATSTHAHDCDMLFVPLAGRFDIVDAQGDALQSSPGHFLWFAAGAAHATSAQTLRQTHLAVYVDSEFWEMALRAQGVHKPAQGMRAGSVALNALSQEMLSLVRAGEGEDRVVAHCGALIMEAARLTAHPLAQPNDRGTPARILAALLADDIEADLARPLSLDAFAQRHRISRRQVERIFKSAFDASPLEFQQRKRLERARHLLESTDDSVLSVAQQVGWESGSYLSRMLGKAWAATAAQIRAAAPSRH
jgi:AraC-like DNA-binding protein